MHNKFFKIIFFVAILFLINTIGNSSYKRFDLTEDQRYTLSETTKNIAKNVNDVVLIKVYLQGNFPAEFKRLQTETKLHLEELKTVNNKIQFRFINPTEISDELINSGLEPSSLQVQENGKLSEILIFPWAVMSYQNKTEIIPLLVDVFF